MCHLRTKMGVRVEWGKIVDSRPLASALLTGRNQKHGQIGLKLDWGTQMCGMLWQRRVPLLFI
jgi:hypothetical protein